MSRLVIFKDSTYGTSGISSPWLIDPEKLDELYMEGVKNHMTEAGIDPNTNDPNDYTGPTEFILNLNKEREDN